MHMHDIEIQMCAYQFQLLIKEATMILNQAVVLSPRIIHLNTISGRTLFMHKICCNINKMLSVLDMVTHYTDISRNSYI